MDEDHGNRGAWGEEEEGEKRKRVIHESYNIYIVVSNFFLICIEL